MATTSKKSAKRRSPTKKTGSGTSGSEHKSVKTLLEEAEKTSDALLQQVRKHFDTLSHRLSVAAGTAAHTTASVTETHLGKEIADFVSNAMDHVREASDATTHAISEGFDVLHERVRATAAPAKKTSRRKKAKVSKKKAAKKKAAKKKVGKKKATTKKKMAKKKTAKKKSSRKKTARKKPASKKRKKAGH